MEQSTRGQISGPGAGRSRTLNRGRRPLDRDL